VPYTYFISTNFVHNLNIIPYGFVFLYPQLREAADESTDEQSAVYRVLARYRFFMVGLILSLLVFNFVFYVIGLIIYLTIVNDTGKSPQAANGITITIIGVIAVLVRRNQKKITAVINCIYYYFNKAEENIGRDSESIEVELRNTKGIYDNDLKLTTLNPIVVRID